MQPIIKLQNLKPELGLLFKNQMLSILTSFCHQGKDDIQVWILINGINWNNFWWIAIEEPIIVELFNWPPQITSELVLLLNNYFKLKTRQKCLIIVKGEETYEFFDGVRRS